METIILNCFGGPGVGKTTTAAAIFSELKKRCVSVELVKEYAKECIYRNRSDMLLNNKMSVFFEQVSRQDIYIGKVRLVVTDSPLLLSSVYQQYHEHDPNYDTIEHGIIKIARNQFARYNNINILIRRNNDRRPYITAGRMQSLKEAIAVDKMVVNEMDALRLDYTLYEYADDIALSVIDDLLTLPERGAF